MGFIAAGIGAIGAKIGAIAAALAPAAPAIGAGVGVYSVVEGRRQAKAAESAAEKMAQQEWEYMERRAGEHFDLTQEQMELQSQYSNIKTLTDVLIAKREPAQPQIFTLPPAKTQTAVQQINQAINRFIRG